MKYPLAFYFCLLFLFVPSCAEAQNKYWVFFKDKPNAQFTFNSRQPTNENLQSMLVNAGVLTQRAINRRLKVLPPSEVISTDDYPVYTPYLDSLKSIGLVIDGTSRWFNAAVVIADSSHLVLAENFSFVSAIKRIVPYIGRLKPINPIPVFGKRLKKVSGQPGDSSFYGPSYAQLELSGIPQVHALGINGSGVLIGMLDAGFRYETHDALKNIKIVGEHDFIQNDSITENQAGDTPDQDSHGTSTLSLLGGYSPGNIVGAAYGADFMLAKTELIYPDPGDVDYKSEEDHWIEGIEWMEARGVDVVSSSLGYNIFVDSLTGAVDSAESYFWSRGEFNGRTALASIAATRAAELGVVVVDACGNEGNGNGIVGTMLIPADADSIIAAGAVGVDSLLTYFSSTGPTNDGRIKPDLTADGEGNYVAVVPGPDTYAYESGTSFATPITAGVAALILSVRPDLTPMQVIDLLKSTAVRVNDPRNPQWTATYPNNFYGWGIVNAWNAVRALGPVGTKNFTFWNTNSSTYIAIRAFSSTGIDGSLSAAYYSIDGASYQSVPLITTDTLDQYAFKLPSTVPLNGLLSFYFNLVDSSSRQIEVPYHGAQSAFTIAGWQLNPLSASENYLLYNNYPNPFNSETHISLVLKKGGHVSVDVYDMLGRKIRVLFDGELTLGYQEFSWNGIDNSGQDVASGVYFIKVNVAGSIKFLKSLYLK